MNSYRVIAFDLDDTLAVSKSQIDPRMATLLARLAEKLNVCIISGGRYEQFESQVLQHLDLSETAKSRLHLMPTCGTRYLRWSADGWTQIYAEDLTQDQKDRVSAALVAGAKELGYWEENTWGDIIEDRGSQITFSALGQKAPPAAKYAWDPDGAKKAQLRDYVARLVPDLEVRSGGSTSIDVTRQGVDKAYGMKRLMEFLEVKIDDILFIGDRLDEGGNDYPVKALGIDCIAVENWSETADTVEDLLEKL
jgi:phosphomannomutase